MFCFGFQHTHCKYFFFKERKTGNETWANVFGSLCTQNKLAVRNKDTANVSSSKTRHSTGFLSNKYQDNILILLTPRGRGGWSNETWRSVEKMTREHELSCNTHSNNCDRLRVCQEKLYLGRLLLLWPYTANLNHLSYYIPWGHGEILWVRTVRWILGLSEKEQQGLLFVSRKKNVIKARRLLGSRLLLFG